MKQLLMLICIFCFAFQTHAQTKQVPVVPSPIVFIYDASGSMWGQIEGKTKMEIASSVLSTSIEELPENQQIGLVAYGHRNKSDCRDVETLVAMDNSSKDEVSSAVNAIKPLGKTPLAYSATQVIDQLRASKQKATVILLTDGVETCDGNICDIVKAAKEEGIDFKLHIVGFGLKDSDTAQLQCAAQAGDGNYYDAADADGLGDAMNEVVTQTVDEPEGNLGVYALKNGEPVDADVQAFMSGTKNKADFARSYKDTVYLFLPEEKYDLAVSPHGFGAVSPVMIKGVQTYNDSTTYKTVSLDGAKINIIAKNNGEMWDSQIAVKTPEGENIIGGRNYAEPELYEVDAGTYNITILARNVSGLEATHTIENVSVGVGEVTEVSHDFNTGIALIGAKEGDTLIDCSVGITDAATGKDIAGARTYKSESSNPRKFILTPGTYNVKLFEAGKYDGSARGEEFTIEVKQGETITKMFEW
jgi:Ca-activated chloride channel family protein